MEPPNGSDAEVGLGHKRLAIRASKSFASRGLHRRVFRRVEIGLRGKQEGVFAPRI
jgi:hypothetical protein